jgi:hypothetical protein
MPEQEPRNYSPSTPEDIVAFWQDVGRTPQKRTQPEVTIDGKLPREAFRDAITPSPEQVSADRAFIAKLMNEARKGGLDG